ncbi:DUF3558 family protein [Frateuria sp. MAH-13]|uniref:DUF3558 family protein n=1 Tax=Frateuria flava TaxID=2821489 RepID=A0ABS4DJN8_9GAMM|nr:DUF3558 family protein [Frateuria flava]MBP1473263.1 DUF3558 family protein [Frateuria flava]
MKRLQMVLLGGLLLAGCSSHDQSTDTTASTSTPSAPAMADQPLDLCQLMPVADVAAILQANGADTVTEQKAGAGGMCSYLHQPEPGDYRAKLLIDFTRMASPEQAAQALAARREDFTGRGIGVTPVPGLGDEAFLAEAEGAAGLKLRVGAYQGQINLRVGERDPASLRPAVLALGKQVVARLH